MGKNTELDLKKGQQTDRLWIQSLFYCKAAFWNESDISLMNVNVLLHNTCVFKGVTRALIKTTLTLRKCNSHARMRGEFTKSKKYKLYGPVATVLLESDWLD